MEPNLNRLSKLNFEVVNEEGKLHNLFYVSIFLDVFCNGLKEAYGRGLQNIFVDFKGQFLRLVVDVDYYEKTASHLFNLVQKDPAFADNINTQLFEQFTVVNAFSKQLLSTDFSKKTNAELISICDKYCLLSHRMITLGMFPTIMEMRQPLYTDFLTQIVDRKNKETNASIAISEAVAILSSFDGDTITKSEQNELIKIALQMQQKCRNNEQVLAAVLKSHVEKYGWLVYGYGGPAWTEKEYLNSLNSFESLSEEHLQEKLHQLQNPEVQKQQAYFEQKLQLSSVEKRYFAIARDFMKGKALRREAMALACYASEPLHREIAKRLNLSFLQVRFMLPSEIKIALGENNVNSVVSETELSKRTQSMVYGLFENSEKEFIATGKEIETYTALIKTIAVSEKIHELKGTCACPGKARGAVKIIDKPEQMSKMQKGDVLVSYATTPEIVAAMRIASAIVTDFGGLTSHAAIVSRELGVPCVIGTKIGTKVFQDGDFVDVDATNGTITRVPP
ncbi:MAG: PEP-utilizing enzyme [Candidatus Micrarchaeota archaeon]